MNITRINCRLLDESTVTLVKPILGLDFVAGLNLDTGRWSVIPERHISRGTFQSLLTELDYPLNQLNSQLAEYLQPMLKQTLQLTTPQRVQQVALNSLHGCFATVTDLSNNQLFVVSISQVQRIEVVLVDNFFAQN